jgi:two-component system sensor histidine kinase TctE
MLLDDGRYRVCTVVSRGRDITLAITATHAGSLRNIMLWGTMVSVLVGILSGVLFGGVAARWGLRPFEKLREQVRRVKPDAPDVAVLEPPAAYSEIEALRAAVGDLVERLGASLALAQRFAAHASHELRTPLTVIAGDLDLALENAASADRDGLLRIRAHVQELSRMIERLLVLAVPSHTRAGEAVDLADAADAVLGSLAADRRSRVRLEREDDVLVEGDPTLLTLALTNAVENALKFSADEVLLRVGGDEHEAWVEVVDEGPGVPSAERERVFEAFYRAAATQTDRTRGLGLGLALVAHVVRGHRGRVGFVDTERGARLRMTFPRWSVVARPQLSDIV